MQVEMLSSCAVCGGQQLRMIDVNADVCKCDACGYIFRNPRPTQAELASFYSAPTKYDDWLSHEHERDLLWERRLAKLRRISKPGTLLDVGTGIGQFLHHARPYYDEVLGTEISTSAIEIAKRRYGLDICEGNIEDIDFHGRRFDNITIFHVLEHVHYPKVVLEECWKLLTDGGVLVIAVPNDIHGLLNKEKVLLQMAGFKQRNRVGKLGLSKIALDGSQSEIHLSHFTPEVLQRIVEKAGFRVIENSLDPYYVADGISLKLHRLREAFYSTLKSISGVNLYSTIWIAATKQAERPD